MTMMITETTKTIEQLKEDLQNVNHLIERKLILKKMYKEEEYDLRVLEYQLQSLAITKQTIKRQLKEWGL